MKIIKYPDNQINVQVEDFPDSILFRISSYEDLFVLKSIKQVYDRSYKQLELKIPCLFGQRSDRVFNDNESFGLKVITDFINSCNFKSVGIFDPHSDTSTALIENSYKIEPLEYIRETLRYLKEVMGHSENLTLISPDAGAYKKLFKYSELLNLPLIPANKFRDVEGSVTLNISGNIENKICLIIDDLLDGGFTFDILGKKLKELGASKVYLYISHAYFNKGIDFTKNIDHFFCTDSVKKLSHRKLTQFIFS